MRKFWQLWRTRRRPAEPPLIGPATRYAAGRGGYASGAAPAEAPSQPEAAPNRDLDTGTGQKLAWPCWPSWNTPTQILGLPLLTLGQANLYRLPAGAR